MRATRYGTKIMSPTISAAHHMMNAAPEPISFILPIRACSSGVTWSQTSSIAVFSASTDSMPPMVRMTNSSSVREICRMYARRSVATALIARTLKLNSSRRRMSIARTEGRTFCIFRLNDMLIVYWKREVSGTQMYAITLPCLKYSPRRFS